MFEGLTRENLEQHVIAEIGRPAARDARVRVVEYEGRRAILKDVSRQRPLARFTFARFLIAREFCLYRALDGLEGVPRAYRMLDKDAFLIEHVDARPAARRFVSRELRRDPAFYDRFLRLVDALHARGVAHLDLHNKKNLLFAEPDRVYLVDFASAVRLPRWLPFRRRLARALGVFDRFGVLKMKRLMAPQLLTVRESRFLRRFDLLRSILWPPHLIAVARRRAVRRRKD